LPSFDNEIDRRVQQILSETAPTLDGNGFLSERFFFFGSELIVLKKERNKKEILTF
jgi:hypothetical protein